jgi:hypothetical protein
MTISSRRSIGTSGNRITTGGIGFEREIVSCRDDASGAEDGSVIAGEPGDRIAMQEDPGSAR